MNSDVPAVSAATMRIGQAAELLDVSVDTLRRWEQAGVLTTRRSRGKQRLIALADVRRLLDERRRTKPDHAIVARSARNRLAGIVSEVQTNGVVATVEILAGPHRLVSLMPAEALEELGLQPGSPAICVVKATAVIVEVPA